MDSDVTGSSNIKGPKIPAPVPVKEVYDVSDMDPDEIRAHYSANKKAPMKFSNEPAPSTAVSAGKAAKDRAEAPSPGVGAAKTLSKLANMPRSGTMIKTANEENENVQWSEAELAHIQSILEANPIAPTPDEYSGPKDGPSIRNLTDETKKPMAKKAMKEESELEEGRGKGAGRGRPAGAKSGANVGQMSGEGGGGGALHPIIQIKDAMQNGQVKGGKIELTHPETGETAKVPADEAKVFYAFHHSLNKAADKVSATNRFLTKHFGSGYSSDDNAEDQAQKDDTAGSAGYSAPSKVGLSKGVYVGGVDRFGNKL
jgi:hypothetical protein